MKKKINDKITQNNWLWIIILSKIIRNTNLTTVTQPHLSLLLSSIFTDMFTKCQNFTNYPGLTSHSQTQSSRQRWVEPHCRLRTYSPVETTWQRWQLGWSWGWPVWASIPLPSGTTHRHYDLLHMSLYGHFWEPSQYLQHSQETKAHYYKETWCY